MMAFSPIAPPCREQNLVVVGNVEQTAKRRDAQKDFGVHRAAMAHFHDGTPVPLKSSNSGLHFFYGRGQSGETAAKLWMRWLM